MERYFLKKEINNLTCIEDYFTAEDSGALFLYDNLMNPNCILRYRKSTREFYFLNGKFPAGEKVLKNFIKKGYIDIVKGE